MLTELVLSNLSEQEKISKDIASAEETLAQALSRLTRLRSQQRSLRDRGAEVFRRGMDRLEAEEEPDSPQPMSAEQQLVGQAQSDGAVGVLDWESVGIVPYSSAVLDPNVVGGPSPDFDWLVDPTLAVGQGSSSGTPPVSQDSGGS